MQGMPGNLPSCRQASLHHLPHPVDDRHNMEDAPREEKGASSLANRKEKGLRRRVRAALCNRVRDVGWEQLAP
jgi:hypothetical protein